MLRSPQVYFTEINAHQYEVSSEEDEFNYLCIKLKKSI
jgi:hypothetical protein